jgi:hypothetical protein
LAAVPVGERRLARVPVDLAAANIARQPTWPVCPARSMFRSLQALAPARTETTLGGTAQHSLARRCRRKAASLRRQQRVALAVQPALAVLAITAAAVGSVARRR